jgi:hypothetical protein
MSATDFERDAAGKENNQRLPYEAPELVDCGEVAKVTQTGATNPGGDGIYS